jgi:hypothetical protein
MDECACVVSVPDVLCNSKKKVDRGDGGRTAERRKKPCAKGEEKHRDYGKGDLSSVETLERSHVFPKKKFLKKSNYMGRLQTLRGTESQELVNVLQLMGESVTLQGHALDRPQPPTRATLFLPF